MRTLVILRHAKAAGPDGVADAQRQLTPKGRADAAAAGAWLAKHGYTPDVVVCSPSRRTRQTWHGVAAGLPTAPVVHYVDRIYAGGLADLLAVIGDLDPEAGTALLVGHNPGVSLLAELLGAGDLDGLRTAGISVHRWEGAWADCGSATVTVAAAHTARA